MKVLNNIFFVIGMVLFNSIWLATIVSVVIFLINHFNDPDLNTSIFYSNIGLMFCWLGYMVGLMGDEKHKHPNPISRSKFSKTITKVGRHTFVLFAQFLSLFFAIKGFVWGMQFSGSPFEHSEILPDKQGIIIGLSVSMMLPYWVVGYLFMQGIKGLPNDTEYTGESEE